MANTKSNTSALKHSSPGLYFNEVDLTYASKSLGITTLGVAGETLRGPAFQPIMINNWRQFTTMFGGTSTAKFKGSQYPKYELPYIAKSYLEQSEQLEVVRVLGLSGVNAGPAWVITANKHRTFTGYTYQESTAEPVNIDWNEHTTITDINELPVAPYVTDEDDPYYRLLTGYGWDMVMFDTTSDASLINGIPCYVNVPDASASTPYAFQVTGTTYNAFGGPNLPENCYIIKASVPTQVTFDEGDVTSNVPAFIKVANLDGSFTYYELPGYFYQTVPQYLYYTKVHKTNIVLAEEDTCGYNNMVVAVIRSRGEHKRSAFVRTPTEEDIANGICDDIYTYDGIEYYAKDIRLEPVKSLKLGSSCSPGYSAITGDFSVDAYNYGKFDIVVTTSGNEEKHYSVSFNAGEKDYIYNVIGGNPEDGDAEIYIEELYDVALKQLVEAGEINCINSEVVKYPGVNVIPQFSDVDDFVENYIITKKESGKRYLYSNGISDGTTVRYTTDNGSTWREGAGLNGMIYTVKSITNQETGKREYFYGAYVQDITTKYVTLENAPENVTFDATNTKLELEDIPSNPTLSDPRYMIVNRDFVENGDSVDTTNGIAVRGHEISEEAKTFDSFHKVINMTIDDLQSVSIQTPAGVVMNTNAKVFSYSAANPTAYMYEWEQEGVNKFNCTNVIAGLNAGNYDFILYTQIPGNYVITLNGTAVQNIDITVAENTNVYFENRPVNIVANTGKQKTEWVTPFNYQSDVDTSMIFRNCVKVIADNMTYVNLEGAYMSPITLDFNNYKESYRYSSTPWIVSEIKGSAEEITLNKLFRFHTISDGNASSSEIKISIENIDPTTGLFDVIVRDFNDSDLNTRVVERFTNCNLVPGSPNYIALKIGSLDNQYVSVSNYITVEVNETDVTKLSTPAGFLGYPLRNYNGTGILDNSIPTGLSTNPTMPYFRFNTTVDEDVKIKRQYFGVSDLVGIDTDVFTYKGVEAYNDMPEGMTPCFHLDARIFNGQPDQDGYVTVDDIKQRVSVDGVTGYNWVTVNKNVTTDEGIEPRIGDDETMAGTIYENKAYRKFTVCFYGGFDGWDYYRTYRSTGDEFTARNYKGEISTSGYGANFSVVKNPDGLDFDNTTKVITSDYYAYLGAIRQFANPKANEINVLATPGIDYVNSPLLVNDVIDMVEEERQDCVYVLTTPDKPLGASDSVDDMYTPDEVVNNLDDSGIDSNYVSTYYPWEKYYDSDNSQYIFLPITRDVVKAIAYTDNVAYSWFAATGWKRGSLDNSAVGPRKKLKLAEQDTLYDGRINFVNTFAGEPDKIWGDKNLQIADSQMNRISTRRLLLRIRTLLKNACISLLFDPNDNSMSKTVKTSVDAVLDDVKQKRGIIDFRTEIDNSPEMRDKHMLGVTYYIKRANNLEYIQFTSVLTPEGMNWD